MVLKRIGPLSAAKISGLLYAVMGLIIGLIFTLVSLLGAALGGMSDAPGGFLPVFFGVGAVVLLPLFYGALGFIGGLITAALYNVLAGMVGGLEIEFEQQPPAHPGPTVP